MGTVVVIRVDNTPAEDEAYRIGVVEAPEGMSDELIQEHLFILYERHKELAMSGESVEDEDFLQSLIRDHGYKAVEEEPIEVVLL